MTTYWPEGRLLNTTENDAFCQSEAGLWEALRTGKILEGRAAVCTQEHDLVVDFGFCKGIIPRAEGAIGIEQGAVRDIALLSRVGKPICFVVEAIDQHPDGSITPRLSRKKAQLRCWQEWLSQLCPGDVIPARVTHLEPFGAFVDVGCGIPSLIPIDRISVSRICHPSNRFVPGQQIYAVILSVAPPTDENPCCRIALSHKELLGSWEENAALFCAGETVSGIIRSVESYGIFVELTPNLAGLAEPKPGAYVGQQASVYIKSLIPEKMKVKLILIDSFDTQEHRSFQYFIQSGHLDRWVYSPAGCSKKIETLFS